MNNVSANVFGLISCVRKKNENQVRPFWILMQVLYSYLWRLTGTQRESEEEGGCKRCVWEGEGRE